MIKQIASLCSGGSQITTTMFRDIMKKRTQIQLKKHSSYHSYLRLIIKTIDYNRRGKRRKEEEKRRKEEEQQRKQEQQEWLDKVKEWIPSFW